VSRGLRYGHGRPSRAQAHGGSAEAGRLSTPGTGRDLDGLGRCDAGFGQFVSEKTMDFLVKHDVFFGESWKIPRKNGWFEVTKMGENAKC